MENGKDDKTQDKIMTAAIKVFTEKGYTAARIRDIADKAGVNLALVNYYYKSKENLFGIIMRRKVKQLFGNIIPVISDENTCLEEKIDRIFEEFHKVITTERNLPLFIFGELQKQDSKFIELIPAEQIKKASFIRQVSQRRPDIHPLHFIINIHSLAFFPYLVAPVMTKAGLASEKEFTSMLKERILYIPDWMKEMLAPR